MAPPGKLDVASVAPQLHKSQQDTKVQYRNLGRSGLRVSVPILGTASFGKKEWQPWLEDDEEKIMELLHGAYIRGLNTWDTANVYSGGWNEQLIGMAIKKFEIPRNKLIILTKISALVPEELAANEHLIPWMKDTKDYVNQGGLSRAAIFNSVEASLARLDTPYIDVLQIHRYDPNVEPEETMKALHDLVQAGKVRYLGASSMWTYQFQKLQFVAEKHNWTKFISMQNQYSLCYREEEREMIKFCKETGVGIIPWSPLYRGLLARPVDSPTTVRGEALKSHPVFKYMIGSDEAIINRVAETADTKGWKMSQVALVWLVQKGAIPITGISNVDRLDDAVGITGKILTEEEMKYLEEPYQTKSVSGHY